METTMTLKVRRSEDRGHANHGWLRSQHSFSFANYYDPEHMGYRSLRVINEDRIDGGTGFGKHPHRDMEIISYVVKGALRHADTMGNETVIYPGEVQKLSAGSGMLHSEFNEQSNDETHFFQIWILPSERGGAPSYGQKSFARDLNTKKLVLVVSGDGRDGSIRIKQDADMYISKLKASDSIDFQVRSGRGVWVQLVSGRIELDGVELKSGDGAEVESSELLRISSLEDSELILFDLA